jgi:hypothetical protein
MRIEWAGADDAFGLVQLDLFDLRGGLEDGGRFEERRVMGLAHMPDLGADHAFEHREPRRVARRRDGVPAIVGHAETVKLARDAGPGAGGIGDQDDRATARLEGAQGRDGLGEGAHAVMHAAPQIAESAS